MKLKVTKINLAKPKGTKLLDTKIKILFIVSLLIQRFFVCYQLFEFDRLRGSYWKFFQ